MTLPSTFRWMAGMLAGDDILNRLTYIYDDTKEDNRCPVMEAGSADGGGPGWGWPTLESGWLPNLTDPATKGCLLELVREASGDAEVSVSHAINFKGVPYWGVWSGDGETLIASGSTEGEALLAALRVLGGGE